MLIHTWCMLFMFNTVGNDILFVYIVSDAVRIRMEAGALQECEANAEVLHSDTTDQFRTFQMCERLLQSPSKVANQLLFQIPPHRQTMLIERSVVVIGYIMFYNVVAFLVLVVRASSLFC